MGARGLEAAGLGRPLGNVTREVEAKPLPLAARVGRDRELKAEGGEAGRGGGAAVGEGGEDGRRDPAKRPGFAGNTRRAY